MRARAQAASTSSRHSAADSPPRTCSLFFRRRPTMSMLSMPTVVFRSTPPSGLRVYIVEPIAPSSSAEGDQDDVAAQLGLPGLEDARDLEQRGGPRGVVVGAVVDLARAGRHRRASAVAEVIVVG